MRTIFRPTIIFLFEMFLSYSSRCSAAEAFEENLITKVSGKTGLHLLSATSPIGEPIWVRDFATNLSGLQYCSIVDEFEDETH